MTLELTPRQLEVMQMRAKGLRITTIARRLGVSKANVSQILKDAMTKVANVRDSLELLRSLGVIEPGSATSLTPEGERLGHRIREEREMRIEALRGVMDAAQPGQHRPEPFQYPTLEKLLENTVTRSIETIIERQHVVLNRETTEAPKSIEEDKKPRDPESERHSDELIRRLERATNEIYR